MIQDHTAYITFHSVSCAHARMPCDTACHTVLNDLHAEARPYHARTMVHQEWSHML